jgi:GLPGLI family protein
MYKKFILLQLLLIFSSNLEAQNYKGIVVYEHVFMNGAINMQKEYILHFDKSKSIYLETFKDLKESTDDNSIQKDNYGTYELNFSNDKKSQFYYYDNLNDNFIFRERVMEESFLVKENKELYDWKILDSIKYISGFKCQLANTNFRGRTYEAWFTNEIAVPYGPWKFNNLPGLILEVSDSSGSFHVVALKLNIDKVNEGDLKTLIKEFDLKDNPITFEEYRSKIKDKNRDILDKINSRLPKGVKPFKMPTDCKDCGQELEIINE